MDKMLEIGLLLDFYGQMLTNRQYEILDMHYNNDFSFGEIAEHLKISRQGVYDNIKRGKAFLNELEEKLGLVGKFETQKIRAEKILNELRSIHYDTLNDVNTKKVKKLEKDIVEMIELL